MSMKALSSARVVRYDGDGLNDSISQSTGLNCKDPSLTKQSEMDACDVNLILKRYERTGALPDMIKENPQWGDFSALPDFQEAQAIVIHATAQFEALDAHVRARFANDPAQFLAFATDKANLEEMRKLGLAKPALPDAPPAVAPGAAAAAADGAPKSSKKPSGEQ